MGKRDNIIEIKGIVRNTKDSATVDGECDELVGMRYKDGSWRPVGALKKVKGSEVIMTSGNIERMWIHRNKYAHVIYVTHSGSLYWGGDMSSEGEIEGLLPAVELSSGPYENPKSMVLTQTGHLITVRSDEKGMQYFMFRVESGKYEEVAADFNSVRDFGLLPYGTIDFKVERVEDENGRAVWFGNKIEGSGINAAVNGGEMKEEDVISNVVNKTKNSVRKLGYFTGAMMVCTAAELYDGTYILMSKPTLLCAPNYSANEVMGGWNKEILVVPKVGRQGLQGCMEYQVKSECGDLYVAVNRPTGQTIGVGNTTMDDIRTGQMSVLPWMHGYLPLGGATFGAADSYIQKSLSSKQEYKYDKELYIDDKDFTAYSMDLWHVVNDENFSKKVNERQAGASAMPLGYIKNLKPLVQTQAFAEVGGDNTYCYMCANKLLYKVNNILSKEYRDIVRKIVVFATREVDMLAYRYGMSVDSITASPHSNPDEIRGYQWSYREHEKIVKELMNEPLMYKIGEISVDLAEADKNKWVELTIEPGTLENLVSQERLKVDSIGRNSYKPEVAFPYNGRLHIANYEEKLFEGWLLQDMFHWGGKGQYPYTKKYLTDWGTGRFTQDGYIKVTLEDSEAKRVVVRRITLKHSAGGLTMATKTGVVPHAVSASVQSLGCILSYPDKRAKEVEICFVDSSVPAGSNNTFRLKAPLVAHDWYNMAYFINEDFKPIDIIYTERTVGELVVPKEENAVEMRPNRMKVSAVDNPLYFPNEQVYSVGNGEIRGLATNAETLVGGQLGDAPLYVMCSDGTYGMFVDSSGQFAYSNSRIISRYVCNNPLGIKAIAGGVVMPTEWGLVLLKGLDSTDVSDKIEGKPFDIENSIPGAWVCIGHKRLVEVQDLCFPKNFTEWLKSAQIAYNHYEKELWVTFANNGLYDEGDCFSYVLGEDGYWTKRKEFGVFVEDFPNVYMLRNDYWHSYNTPGEMVDLQREDFSEATEVMFMSRMIKAGTQEFKQTERLIVRGDFKLPEHHEIAKVVDFTSYIKAKGDIIPVSAENPEVIELNERNPLQHISGEVLYKKTFAVVESTGEMNLASETGLNWSNGNSLKEGLNNKSEMRKGTVHKMTWTRLEEVSKDVPEFRYDEDDDVCVKFGNKSPYKANIGLNSTEGYLTTVMMFPNGWEGKYSRLVDIVRGESDDSNVVFKRDTLNSGILEYTWGTTQPTSQDQIGEVLAYDNNYKVILTSGTTLKRQQTITAWRKESNVPQTTGCYDLAMAMLRKGLLSDWQEEKKNNSVTLAAGNVASDDGMLFNVTSSQAGSYLYYEIEEKVASGEFGRSITRINFYELKYGKCYRLGEDGDVFECNEGGRYTWLELQRKVTDGEFVKVRIVESDETIGLTFGNSYWFKFSNIDGINDLDRQCVYVGNNLSRSISWIRTNINDWTTFIPITSDGYLAMLYIIQVIKLSLKVGEVVLVKFADNTQKRVMITGDNPDVRGLITKTYYEWEIYFEEAEEYEGGEAPKAGLYLWGSYDGKKWALLGARERDGEFRDLGLESHRVDCKYFKLQFCGKLLEGSSIEYIEQQVKERLYDGKIR